LLRRDGPHLIRYELCEACGAKNGRRVMQAIMKTMDSEPASKILISPPPLLENPAKRGQSAGL